MKHRNPIVFGAIATVAAALAFSGCATNSTPTTTTSQPAASVAPSAAGSSAAPTFNIPKKDKYVIGYSQSNNAEPYRAQVNIQLAYYVKQHSNLELLPISDAQQDSSRQVSQVQQFIQEKVDFLIVSPNEPDPLTPPVEQACQAGIPVIILDRSVNTNCIAAFIGGDNVAAGKAAGELAAQLLPNGGNVVELQGILSDQPQIDRDKGFAEGIASNPKITIVKKQEAKWLRANAEAIMQQWLQSGVKPDLVYAQNDEMAFGAQIAAQGAGVAGSMKFIGTDGLAIPGGGIRAVQDGQFAGTFMYPTCAPQAVDTIEAMINGQPFSSHQTLDVQAITPQNAASMYTQYDFSSKS